jgi:hypothetical protein
MRDTHLFSPLLNSIAFFYFPPLNFAALLSTGCGEKPRSILNKGLSITTSHLESIHPNNIPVT